MLDVDIRYMRAANRGVDLGGFRFGTGIRPWSPRIGSLYLWRSVRKPLISDDGPVAGGFYEHPRLAVTIPCAILVRILRDHLGPLRTVRRPGSGTKQR